MSERPRSPLYGIGLGRYKCGICGVIVVGGIAAMAHDSFERRQAAAKAERRLH